MNQALSYLTVFICLKSHPRTHRFAAERRSLWSTFKTFNFPLTKIMLKGLDSTFCHLCLPSLPSTSPDLLIFCHIAFIYVLLFCRFFQNTPSSSTVRVKSLQILMRSGRRSRRRRIARLEPTRASPLCPSTCVFTLRTVRLTQPYSAHTLVKILSVCRASVSLVLS